MNNEPMEDDEEELFPDDVAAVGGEDDGKDENEAALAEKASATARKLEPVVLAHVNAANYQPVKPRVIAKQLKLPSEQHRALKLAIRRLVKTGKMAYGSGHI